MLLNEHGSSPERLYFWVAGPVGAVSWSALKLDDKTGRKMAAIWEHRPDEADLLHWPDPVQHHDGEYWMTMDLALHYADPDDGDECDLVPGGRCSLHTGLSLHTAPTVLIGWLKAGKDREWLREQLTAFYMEMAEDADDE
jgi:hypothetical protein